MLENNVHSDIHIKAETPKKHLKNFLEHEKYFLSTLSKVTRLEERKDPCKFRSKLMLKEVMRSFKVNRTSPFLCQDVIMKIAREGLDYIQKRENFWSEMGSCSKI